MCDLFALSATKDYSAPELLPIFALRAKKNMDGWGIGFFRKHHAVVEKSAEQIFYSGQLHDSFQRLARVVKSRIIICHIRLRTSGLIDECHAHPFALSFGGHDWIFVHNGKAPAIESYRSKRTAIEDAISDSARVFEYLRDQIEDQHTHNAGPNMLFNILMTSTAQMIDQYPGNYNFLLTNGHLLFAFTNHRQFMVMKGSRKLQGALLLTTLARGLSKEEKWLRVAKATNRRGLLLAISGNDVIIHKSI
ncbi:MAG: class II glutamine amidotransferase [Desulfobacterales bacterium]|nr:MAG: class II glutamine amidotransferase [Desulfobacterales bacterium]